MSDTAPATGTETTPPADTGDQASDTTAPSVEQLVADVEKWKTQSRKHEERAKQNATAARELEELRKASMTEQEKAVADARAQARAEAIAEISGQLVDARIEAAAAGRLAPEQLATLLTSLNRASFLNEDGTVNADAVTAFVDGIAPSKPDTPPPFPDLGQGARSGPLPLNGDPLETALRQKIGA